MIDIVYASLLGLFIPIIFFNISRITFGHISGRKKVRGGRLVTRAFLLKTFLLIAACWLLKGIVDGIDSGVGYFDPFEILEVDSGAGKAEIRQNYKRLSLKYHPDKNPGDKRAVRRFTNLNKAYRALNDPVGKRNYELFGNPDGPQRWTYDVPLPDWLSPGRNAPMEVLILYTFGYFGVLLMFIWGAKMVIKIWDPSSSSLAVSAEDAAMLVKALGEETDIVHLIECIANAPQLITEQRKESICGINKSCYEPTVQKLREALIKSNTMPLVVPASRSKKKADSSLKAIQSSESLGSSEALSGFYVPTRNPLVEHNLVLLLAALHEKREDFLWEQFEMPETVKVDQEFILKFAQLLMDVCLQVAASQRSLILLTSVINCKTLLKRRLWSTSGEQIELLQAESLKLENVAVPKISISMVKVETWGEPQIAVGDTVTATISLKRAHAEEYRGFNGLRPTEGSPVYKGEPWWIMLASIQPNGIKTLIGVSPTVIADLEKTEIETAIKFQAPRTPGHVAYIVTIKSSVFVGIEAEYSGSFEVLSLENVHDVYEETSDNEQESD